MAKTRRTIVSLLALAALALLALPVAAGRPDEYTLPGEAVFPEGIAAQQSTGNFFVGSTTDGTLFRGHANEPATQVFIPGGSGGCASATGLEVDDRGRLWVAGAGSDCIAVYQADSGALLAKLTLDAGFLNDQAVTPDGSAFFTDSQAPVLYRVFQDGGGAYQLEAWLDYTGTPIQHVPNQFNLNGIVITPNGRYLIVVQSNTGKLFRIEVATKQVVEIDLGGATVTAGDGLVLRGSRLYVVRNSLGQIDVVRLNVQQAHGAVVDTITDHSFAFPTTAALARGRLLVVNSQFNRRDPGLMPELPFTVSAVKP